MRRAHVRLADEAVSDRPPAARESYPGRDRSSPRRSDTGAQAIHPGYGFVGERTRFAEGLRGGTASSSSARPPSAIRAMGLKSAGKKLMERPACPTPGYHGDDQGTTRGCWRRRPRIGFPVLIKASAGGGGGKGMRVVRSAGDSPRPWRRAEARGQSAFGDDQC